ncbi:MAG: NifB/NifX family molybdenum-iron cluster-binding protein [Methanobrevibacter sp.]
MKFAFASTDGRNVNLHFGKASSIYVYNYDDDNLEFQDKITVEIEEDKPHQGVKIVKALKEHGVDTIFVGQIGFKSKVRVDDAGIKVIVDEGPIEEVLERYIKHLEFMDKPLNI